MSAGGLSRGNSRGMMAPDSSLSRIFSGGLAVLAVAGAAQAQDLPQGRPGQRAAASRCAVYGPGFVPVAGSDTCIKIGGHVRVEYGWGNPPPRGGSGFGGGYGSASTTLPYGEPAAAAPSPLFGRLRPDAAAGMPAARRR